MKHFELYDTFSISMDVDQEKKSMMMSDTEGVKKDYNLVCEVDATHAGTLINNRIYPPEGMQKGLKTWTKPYKKPVLTNHDDSADPIGRVMKAKYVSTDRGDIGKDYKPILKESDGYGYTRLTLKITDPTAIQKILDGRYDTVSVRMTTDHAFCSICDCDWSDEGPCEHMPGQKYDGKLTYITTGDLSYREVSFVNIPADGLAGVKEALLNEDSDTRTGTTEVLVFANNAEDKVLSSLGGNNNFNLYDLLDSDIDEGDDVVLHLLDKSSKVEETDKEEDVKPEELTKDQLASLPLVKELIDNEVAEIKKTIEQEDMVSKEEHDKVLDELKTLKDADEEEATKEEEAKEEVKEEEVKIEEKEEEVNEEIKEEEKEEVKEEVKEEEKEEEVKEESEGEEKVEEPSEEVTPEEEAPKEADSEEVDEVKTLKDELAKKEEERKRVLDENVRINTELHKMVAERLYDLKRTLNKPDVTVVKTPDERDKMVEELSQRSIDSLKDQISDLILEQEKFGITGQFGEGISSPGLAQADKTNEVDFSKQLDKSKSKKDTLKRLFSKGE